MLPLLEITGQYCLNHTFEEYILGLLVYIFALTPGFEFSVYGLLKKQKGMLGKQETMLSCTFGTNNEEKL